MNLNVKNDGCSSTYAQQTPGCGRSHDEINDPRALDLQSVPALTGNGASSPPSITGADGGIHLLNALWLSPEKAHQICGLDRKTKSFKNIPVRNALDAMVRAQMLSDSGIDPYFAPGEFHTSKSRTRDNAVGASIFFVDVDVGADKATKGQGYPTIELARAAINRFCTETGLPYPTHIVESGSGLQAFWAQNEFIEREHWDVYAQKLKAIAKTLGFLADPTRTADIASVMRIPGTLNHKYVPPRPVTLIYADTNSIQKSVMCDCIDSAHARIVDSAKEATQAVRPIGTPIRSGDGMGQSTRNGCATGTNLRLLEVILQHLDPDCGYGQWFRIAAAIFNETKGSDEGFILFDKWSSTGQQYRGKEETRRKWASLSLDHPNPIRIATLRQMVEANGHEWSTICVAAEDAFELTVTVEVEA